MESSILFLVSSNTYVENVVMLFKSDRGALSVKELREALLTTRSSSERSLLFSVVLMSGDS